MLKSIKKFFDALINGTLLAIAVPLNVLAAEGTIDETVSPYLYCVYYNSDGEQVDGNGLPSGDYRVDVMLEGMDSLSVFQYTAEYDPSTVTSLSTEAVIDTMRLGGIKDTEAANGKRRVVLVLASEGEDGTELDHLSPVTLATMQVTVDCDASAIDFADYFTFVEDPDLTFAEAYYHDGIEYSYVVDTNEATDFNVPTMKTDVTPAFAASTITVSGKVFIAVDEIGTASNYGLRGVKIYADDNDNNVIAETVSNAEGDKSTWGDYSLEVPVDTTSFEVGDPVKGNDTIVNRRFSISGVADVTDANVAVVMCDYNDDGVINSTDKGRFNDTLRGEYSIYADFNLDGVVNPTDKGRFNDLLRTGDKGINYVQLSFD